MIISTRLFLISIILCFSSCVSNKKHQAALDLRKKEHQAEVTWYSAQLDSLNKRVYDLELNVAERIGENNILLVLREELQTKISNLETTIENLSTSSNYRQKNLNATLNQKEEEIEILLSYLAEIDTTIDQHENIIRQVTDDLNAIAQDHSEDIEVSFGFDYAAVAIGESFLFRRNSATRLQDNGTTVLERFAAVIVKYPNTKIRVVGHTDTAPPKDKKRYGDNWNFSALQSATVVRVLIEDFDLNANQLMLAAKAEFAPRASNATSEGKAKNRRIELYITMDSEDLAKKIRQTLSKVN